MESKSIFVCAHCMNHWNSEEEKDKHICMQNIYLDVPFSSLNLPKRQRFKHWLLENLKYITELLAGVTINALILSHLDWPLWQTCLEGFCFGWIFPNLIRKQ